MYAVVAPGFSCVYSSWSDVERIKALYPYPKFAKFSNEEAALEWIRRNKYARRFDQIYNYGNTFSDLYVTVKYHIGSDCIYYVLDCSKLGRMRLHCPDALVEYKGSKIYIKVTNVFVSNETIAGHMSVLHNLFSMIGPYVDLNLELDHYALYYALTVYSKGNNRYVQLIRDTMKDRIGGTAISLKIKHLNEEEDLTDG